MKQTNYMAMAFSLKSQLEINNDHKDLVVTNCGYFISHNQETNFFAVDDNNQFLLLYNHFGKIEMIINGEVVTIPEHSILIFSPKEVISYKFVKDETSERYYVYFKGKKALECLKKFGLTGKRFFTTPNLPNIIPIFKNIIYDFSFHDFDTEIYRTSFLLQILNSISLSLENKSKTNNPIVGAITYIQNNYNSNINLRTLSRNAFMSVNSFINNFKRQTGKTPIQYLNEYRLNNAQSLLIESDMSITDICNQVGYLTPAHFSNAFKKEIGISPTEFRNTHKKEIK